MFIPVTRLRLCFVNHQILMQFNVDFVLKGLFGILTNLILKLCLQVSLSFGVEGIHYNVQDDKFVSIQGLFWFLLLGKEQ